MSSPTDPTGSTSSTTPTSSTASAPATPWSDERWYAEDAAVLAGVEKLRVKGALLPRSARPYLASAKGMHALKRISVHIRALGDWCGRSARRLT